MTAIKAAAAHLGTLREGRKTLIVVTEGFGVAAEDGFGPGGRGIAPPPFHGALQRRSNTALDIVRMANDTNTAVHVIDPRGLQVAGGSPLIFETVAYGSGGELHRSNDLAGAIQRIVGQASATYLLGYTPGNDPRRTLSRDQGQSEARRLRRAGARGILGAEARGCREGEGCGSGGRAASADCERVCGAESAELIAAGRDLDRGPAGCPAGRSQVTVAWTPLRDLPAGVSPAAVSVALKSGETLVEGAVQPGGTSFDVPEGPVQLSIRVLDRAGEIVDRETRSVDAPPAEGPLWLSAVVHRAATPAEARTLLAADAPIYAGREFVRTDRLLIRLHAYGKADKTATITGRLIDRRGATLLPLAISGSPDAWQIDLPLASIAPGDFALAFEAQSGDERAEAIVPLSRSDGKASGSCRTRSGRWIEPRHWHHCFANRGVTPEQAGCRVSLSSRSTPCGWRSAARRSTRSSRCFRSRRDRSSC